MPDKEKYFSELDKSPHYTQISSKRKHLFVVIVEAIIAVFIYYQYDYISTFHSSLIAPSLLGSFTAALAQSINQYAKHKFSVNKIVKFLVWGSINGCFTVLWIDVLITQTDNVMYRVLADQLVAAPLFQLVFNILNALWDHGELNGHMNGYFHSLKYSYCFWPFFLVASFVFVPKEFMFPANCAANLIWNLILSKITA